MVLEGDQTFAASGSNSVCLPGDGRRFDVWDKRVIFSLAHSIDDA